MINKTKDGRNLTLVFDGMLCGRIKEHIEYNKDVGPELHELELPILLFEDSIVTADFGDGEYELTKGYHYEFISSNRGGLDTVKLLHPLDKDCTIGVYTPWFRSFKAEQEWRVAQATPEVRAKTGAHKSFMKKKPLGQRLLNWMHTSKLIMFLVDLTTITMVWYALFILVSGDPTIVMMGLFIFSIIYFYTTKN